MKNKALIAVAVVAALALIGGGIWLAFGNRSTVDVPSDDNNNNSNTANNEGGNMNDKKALVAYYSAQSHTEAVAEKIAANLGADLFKITPVDEYTSDDLDYYDNDSRVTREHDDESLRDVALTTTTPENWADYDTVLIGYPIWWGIAAWPVNNFVKDNDFTGKTVIPFCTSASSSLGQSGELLAEMAGTGDWQEGQRFSSNASGSDIKTFTDSL